METVSEAGADRARRNPMDRFIDGIELLAAAFVGIFAFAIPFPIIIVAGRGSGFDASEKRANFAIYKDIDIESQLEKALTAVLGKKILQAAAGK